MIDYFQRMNYNINSISKEVNMEQEKTIIEEEKKPKKQTTKKDKSASEILVKSTDEIIATDNGKKVSKPKKSEKAKEPELKEKAIKEAPASSAKAKKNQKKTDEPESKAKTPKVAKVESSSVKKPTKKSESKTPSKPAKKDTKKIDPTSAEALKEATKKITKVTGPVIINKPTKVQKKNAPVESTPVKTKTPPKKTEVKPVKVPKAKPKLKLETKEDKLAYKKIQENFNYIANLTWVIEEKTMDPKQIPDLTLGEIHVLETVDNHNNEPMTTIARALKVTVGSLITCVNRLIAKEYLIRIRDEDDRRVIRLSVTPKAKKIIKVHDKFHEEIINSVLEGVTLRDTGKVLAQIARVLENYINPIDVKEIINDNSKSTTKKPRAASSKTKG